MPFAFTWIPGIHEKIIINTRNNDDNNANEQQQKKELFDRALAIVANITGLGGLYYYY